jgi:hypothetical protein
LAMAWMSQPRPVRAGLRGGIWAGAGVMAGARRWG